MSEYEMKKIDSVVLRETAFVAVGTALLCVLMNAVFLVIGKWDLKVLFGPLLGYAVSVLNFFLMGLSVQGSLGKEEKDIKTRMRVSLILRELLLLAVALAAYFLKGVFNIIPLVITYVFPRIVITFRPRFKLRDDVTAIGDTDVEGEKNE